MKLTTFLMLISFIGVFASETYSQTTKLSLKVSDNTLEELLIKIENQSEFKFFYTGNIDVEKRISGEFKNKRIDEILDQIKEEAGIDYVVMGRQIILSPDDQRVSLKSVQQKKSISGVVTDYAGLPLPGVTVLIKGTTNGTVTNGDGEYTISDVTEGVTLQFSFVGMKTQEIIVENQSILNVSMREDAIGIEEVVAVGYGTARKNDFTGSVNSVKVENTALSSLPNTSALEVLKGTTPGLNVGVSTSAGDSPSVLIRGQNSINGSNDPLVVLDGVIFLGDLRDINPDNIATFDILKDASSSAAYGSRSANGVILITTKQGKTEKPTITLNVSTGVSVWQNKPKLMGPDRYIEKVNASYNLDDPLAWMEEPTKVNYQNGKTVNWIDEVSRVAPTQKYQLSVSGKSKGVNYFLSSGYTNQKGVLLGDDYERVSISGKINTDITDWLQVGLSGDYYLSDYSGMTVNLNRALPLSPYGSLYRDESTKLIEKYPVYQSFVNPLWGINDGTVDDINKRSFYKLYGFAKVDIPFVKGLSYRISYVGSNSYINKDRFFYEGYYVSEGSGLERYSPQVLEGYLSSANGSAKLTRINNYVFDNVINYKNEFNNHYIDMTLVATRDYGITEITESIASDFAANGNTSLGTTGLHKGTVQKIDRNNTETANVGYLARLSYSYKDRYHLTASIRRDGSSVFGADKKWGNFSALGLAWTVSNEDFLKTLNVIDYLKLKASYGENGNQGIAPYATLSQVQSGVDGNIAYSFSNSSNILYGTKIETLGNSTLGWEKTSSLNGGIESSWLKNRISLDVDFYFSKTTDQLFTRNIPPMTGFTSIKASMGQVNNRGIEVNLKTVNIEKNDWKWISNFIFWQNRNKIVELYGDDIDGDGKEEDDIANGLFIGKSLGAIYGYEFDGIVQEDDLEYMEMTGSVPGDAKFKDLNDDGAIDADNDRKILGYAKDNFRLNLSNTIQYKNFDLYILMSGIFGGGKDNYYQKGNVNAYMTASDRGKNNAWDHIWWTPENKSNIYPSISYNDGKFKGLQSRSFVRIQDVVFSYKLNSRQLSALNISSLKIFASIKNLYTFTNWEGGDPEAGIQVMSSAYPVPTTYSMGVNFSF